MTVGKTPGPLDPETIMALKEVLDDAWARLSVAMNNAVTLTMTPKEALDQAQKEIAALVG